MKTLLTIMALACLLLTGATIPPPPLPVLHGAVTTGTKPLPTNVIKRVRFVPPPQSYGVSYTNKLSLLDSNRWVSGVVRAGNTRYVPHDLAHDTNTNRRTVTWASQPARLYAFEVAWGEFPLATRTEERTLVTNMHPTTVFYAIGTNGGWFGTNRSAYSFDWPVSNMYLRIVEI